MLNDMVNGVNLCSHVRIQDLMQENSIFLFHENFFEFPNVISTVYKEKIQ